MNRDDIIRMAREAGGSIWEADWCFEIENLERFAALVAEKEREACAKLLCEVLLSRVSTGDEHMDGVWDCINAIRARGQK